MRSTEARKPASFHLAVAVLAMAFFVLPGPASAQPNLVEAQRLFELGRFEDSRTIAIEAINANPNDLDSYVVLCNDLLGLGRWADAQNYALKAYQVKRDPRITAVLGEAAYRLGDNAAALKHFQNYVAAIPESTGLGNAYYLMGEIYLRMARYSHADIAITAALQFSPGNSRWWVRLGWAREKANDKAGALAAYRQALVLEPNLEDALLGQARVFSPSRG